MNKPAVVLTITILLLILTISASCEEGQININSASAEKLDNITQVGPATAEEIIKNRPFNSLDELIDVKYIGDKKLALIKEQGLACVEIETEEPVEEAEEDEETTKEENVVEEFQEIKEPVSRETGPVELPGINLNPALHG